MDFQFNMPLDQINALSDQEPSLEVDDYDKKLNEHRANLDKELTLKYIMVMDKGVYFDFPGCKNEKPIEGLLGNNEQRESRDSKSLYWTAFMGVSCNWPFLVY